MVSNSVLHVTDGEASTIHQKQNQLPHMARKRNKHVIDADSRGITVFIFISLFVYRFSLGFFSKK